MAQVLQKKRGRQAQGLAVEAAALRMAIADARKALERGPGAPPGQAEDVRQTLGLWQAEPWGGTPFPPPLTPGLGLP